MVPKNESPEMERMEAFALAAEADAPVDSFFSLMNRVETNFQKSNKSLVLNLNTFEYLLASTHSCKLKDLSSSSPGDSLPMLEFER